MYPTMHMCDYIKNSSHKNDNFSSALHTAGNKRATTARTTEPTAKNNVPERYFITTNDVSHTLVHAKFSQYMQISSRSVWKKNHQPTIFSPDHSFKKGYEKIYVVSTARGQK